MLVVAVESEKKMLTMSHFKQKYYARTPWASRTALLRSPTSKGNMCTGQWLPTIAILATYCGEMPPGSVLKMALGQALSLSAKPSAAVNRPRWPTLTTDWPTGPRRRGLVWRCTFANQDTGWSITSTVSWKKRMCKKTNSVERRYTTNLFFGRQKQHTPDHGYVLRPGYLAARQLWMHLRSIGCQFERRSQLR